MTHLTAIIPTRDRADLLSDCLATLAKQVVDAGVLEVIVVDDGSRDPMSPIVANFDGRLVSMRCIRQEPGGLNAARNTGAAQAQGMVLAFLDDDIFVAPEWAAAITESLSSWGWDGLAGKIQLELEGPEPTWLTPRLRNYLTELDLGSLSHWMADDTFPYGANCAVSKEMFERVGGFRLGLDRIGASLVSNGDIEFFMRVRAQGGKLLWCPAAHVFHRVPRERLTTEFFMRRAYAQGVSDVLLEPQRNLPARVRGFARDLLRLLRAGPILAKNLIEAKQTVPASVWVSYCRGRLAARRKAVA